MLHAIFQWWHKAQLNGESWAEAYSFLNILQYVTVRAALACLIAFLLSLILGPRVIRKLISLKVGQPIRSAEEVHKLHELHGAKAGTPTMGGVLILGTVSIAMLLCGSLLNPFVVVTMFVMLGLGCLGFMDDYAKVKQKNSDGLSAKVKLVWQGGIALVAALFLFSQGDVVGNKAQGEQSVEINESGSSLVEQTQQEFPEKGYWLKDDEVTTRSMPVSSVTFPLFKKPILDLGWFAIPFFTIIIIGASNAVNLTDGLDGLATGCTITVSLAYGAIAYVAGHFFLGNYLNIPYNPLLSELTIFLLAMVGASFGFLWFNCHPAKVFMGDTGSLAIGGAIGTVAICTKQELLLVLIGWVFVMEALSVMIQVGSFKLRRKRVFAMAPIHHHFELRGWHESQVIIRFWILSIICALIGLSLLKIT